MILVGNLEQELARVFRAVSQHEKSANPGAVRKIDRLKKQILILKSLITTAKRRTTKEH